MKFAFVLVAVLAFSAGALCGDWTAQSRFDERAASIIDYVAQAKVDAERIRDSIREGCFAYVSARNPQ